jgi:uncharacterized protein (DUF305 family)
MKTKKTILIALGVAAAVAAGGVAIAQSTQSPMQHMGPGQMGPGQMGPGMMHGGMQERMQGMHGNMHANMHSGGGMQHGNMHAQMHGAKGGMHGGGMQHGGGHGSGHGPSAATGDQSASSLAFAAVNDKMHRDMAISFTGNADADFARGMIPHHQGAVDMAKIVIAFGKDPEIRKLAEEIVKAQETEIAFMEAWLKKQGIANRN